MPDPVQRARLYVQTAFSQLKVRDEIAETALIRDGLYCGHRFSAGNLSAVWFFEENEVKIFDEHRKLLRVESLQEEQPILRRAA